MASSFDAYLKRRARDDARVWFAIVVVCLAVGFAVSQATSILLGGIVTIPLLVVADFGYARVSRALLLRRFPELRDPNVTWRRRAAWFNWSSPQARSSQVQRP